MSERTEVEAVHVYNVEAGEVSPAAQVVSSVSGLIVGCGFSAAAVIGAVGFYRLAMSEAAPSMRAGSDIFKSLPFGDDDKDVTE